MEDRLREHTRGQKKGEIDHLQMEIQSGGLGSQFDDYVAMHQQDMELMDMEREISLAEAKDKLGEAFSEDHPEVVAIHDEFNNYIDDFKAKHQEMKDIHLSIQNEQDPKNLRKKIAEVEKEIEELDNRKFSANEIHDYASYYHREELLREENKHYLETELTDTEFGAFSFAARMKRIPEIYRWVEEKNYYAALFSSNHDVYKKRFTPGLEQTSSFKHKNPDKFGIAQVDFSEGVMVGDYYVVPEIVRTWTDNWVLGTFNINDFSKSQKTHEVRKAIDKDPNLVHLVNFAIPEGMTLKSKSFLGSYAKDKPQIGDYRIAYKRKECKVCVLCLWMCVYVCVCVCLCVCVYQNECLYSYYHTMISLFFLIILLRRALLIINHNENENNHDKN